MLPVWKKGDKQRQPQSGYPWTARGNEEDLVKDREIMFPSVEHYGIGQLNKEIFERKWKMALPKGGLSIKIFIFVSLLFKEGFFFSFNISYPYYTSK